MSTREISLDSWNYLGEEVRPNHATEIRDAVLSAIPEGMHGDERILDIVYDVGKTAMSEGYGVELAAEHARNEVMFHILTSAGIQTVEAPVLAGSAGA